MYFQLHLGLPGGVFLRVTRTEFCTHVFQVVMCHAARHSVHTLQPETHAATTLQNL